MCRSRMDKQRILILSSEPDIMGRWFKRLRPLAKLHHHLSFSFHHIWYGSWKEQLKSYDTIIIFGNYWTRSLVPYIRRKNARCRIIVYFLNPIDDLNCRSSPLFFRDLPCELYSFDKADCAAIGMKHNPWCLPIIYPLKPVPQVYDAFFIGSDKGRIDSLIELKRSLDGRGYKTSFIIVKDPKKKYTPAQLRYITDDRVPYEAVVEMIQQSRCLVEILQAGQSGMTERTMEAVVYRKKLITTNEDVVTYDFYRRENIFVLGKDPSESMDGFMTSPPVALEESVYARFTGEAWLQRFFEPQPGGE
jgi:hypothetical protein